MSKISLNGIKDTCLNKASNVLLRVNILSEEAKLDKLFKKLGERVFQALLEKDLEVLKNDPVTVELLGEIEEQKKSIQEMQIKLQKEKNN